MTEAVDTVEAARSYCEQMGICEVPICGMEDAPLVLHGVDGNRYIGGILEELITRLDNHAVREG